MRKAVLALALGCAAGPLFAGGFKGAPTCAELVQSGAVAGTYCMNEADLVVVEAHPQGGFWYRIVAQRPAGEWRGGRWCPYPHRPSDSVFVNGSGYLLKDTVRAAIGCDWP